MRLTDAENYFFDLIQTGSLVSNKTTDKAKCARAYSTVIRQMGLVNEYRKYNGPNPIDREDRLSIKKNVYKYNNDHKKTKTKAIRTPSVHTHEKTLFETLKAAKIELERIGFVVEIKITKEINL